ncbi:hypothetical protein CSKR_105096 [Clonorchis sinensis]|uniref:Uncharacterized protein n=1 Tax=Clonorchis sinensis TaxID=79923 RepID=A0A3R7GUI3_CLOSI|nr:hypothetical protein CSKR_105096 [Clonorchis sinensis]
MDLTANSITKFHYETDYGFTADSWFKFTKHKNDTCREAGNHLGLSITQSIQQRSKSVQAHQSSMTGFLALRRSTVDDDGCSLNAYQTAWINVKVPFK